MRITRLSLRNLRCFEQAELRPGPGLNLLLGDNGAGKTSVLEALHLMAHGRSFRARVRDGLVRAGTAALEVFVEWTEETSGRQHRVGLEHSGQQWRGRLDGADVSQLAELCAALAVVSFEPGSHALVMGAGEQRRRFVDWGLFHVEPEFLGAWRRYARALKQRNALLKSHARAAELEAWEQEMAATGEILTRRREAYLDDLWPRLQQTLGTLAPGLPLSALEFQPGWKRTELPLADALLLSRQRDLALGYSGVGPHRADWQLAYAGLPGRQALSRGQAKLVALAALLAQAAHHGARMGEWPALVLDDLGSELDQPHQQRVLAWLRESGAQAFISGTHPPTGLQELDLPTERFRIAAGAIVPADGVD